jgi:hypothetical protein
MERHYHHGDRHEGTGQHYCRRCDAFEGAEHFAACAPGEGAERRRRDERTSRAVKRHERWRVVYRDTRNLFA